MKALLLLTLPALAHAEPCEKRGAPLLRAGATDAQITACFGDDSAHRCWLLDVATKTWSPTTTEPPATDSAPAAPAEEFAITTTVEICVHKDCHSISTLGTSELPHVRVAANADRSLVAVARTPGPLELFDGTKRVASLKAWNKTMIDGFEMIDYVGDTLIARVPVSPVSSETRLYNGRTGALLAKVGGGGGISEDPPQQLTKTEYLFAAFETSDLFVHDIVTGRLVQKIGGAFARVTSDKKFVYAIASGALIYDVATHHTTRIPVPTCK